MRHFTIFLAVIAAGYLLAGLVLKILPPDTQILSRLLIAMHTFSSAGTTILGALSTGLLLSGSLLLLIAAGLTFLNRKAASPIAWPARKLLLLAIGLNFCLGLMYVSLTPSQPIAADDTGWYLAQAEQLAKRINPSVQLTLPVDPPSAYWPIGYPVFLSLFFMILGSHLWVTQAVNLLCLAGIILLIYLLGRDLFDSGTAARAALVTALIPSVLFMALPTMSELYFTSLTLLLLYLIQKKTHPYPRVVLMGLIFGLALMTREIAVFIPVVGGIYWRLTGRRWKSVLARLALIYLLGELILLPWQIRNYEAYGRFVPLATHGGHVFWLGNNPNSTGHGPATGYPGGEEGKVLAAMNEAERDAALMQLGLGYVKAHPWKTLAAIPKKAFFLYYRDSQCVSWAIRPTYQLIPAAMVSTMYLGTEGFYYALGLAFILSTLAFLKAEGLSPRGWLILGTIIAFTVVYVPILPESRYHLPLLPLFALLAVAGVSRPQPSSLQTS